MYKPRSIFLALWLLLSTFPTVAQVPALTEQQTERLVRLSQLWGHTHFFHPHLAYKNLPWDSAFAAAVPRILAAPDTAAYARALKDLVAALDDPGTRVETGSAPLPEGSFSEKEPHPIARFDADSVLVVTLRNYHDLQDWNAAAERFDNIAQMVPRAKAVLFDLRSDLPTGAYVWYFDYGFSESGLKNMLSDKPVVTPGLRTRQHDGFAPEGGNTSGGYSSGFAVRDGERITPKKGARALPVVFLLNENSVMPPVALGLQAAAQGGIVAQGQLDDAALAGSVGVDMGEGTMIYLRTGELVAPDGTVGLQPNLRLPADEPDARALQAALDFLKKGDFHLKQGAGKPPMAAAPSKPVYPAGKYPELGYRVLAAAKVWSVIHYFFAYKELMPQDWNATLREFLPRIAAAPDSLAYVLAIAEMYARIEDGHGFINSPVLWDYFGRSTPPFVVRIIEDRPVITGVANDSLARAGGYEVGDVITHIDGEPAAERLGRFEKYIAASNPNWRRYIAAERFLRGPNLSAFELRLQGRNGREKTVKLTRDWLVWKNYTRAPDERTGVPVIRILPGNIGYADLERLRPDQVDTLFEQLKNTRAIIFDMRGYPQGTAWSIAPRLTRKDGTAGAFFQRYVALQPDQPSSDGNVLTTTTKHSFYQPIPPAGNYPKYTGKTVMLIDERTMSQAEHSGLFFEAANGTEFIGSQTAGANGDVTNFSVPGQISLSFSGHDVRHADGRQLQKTGLVPKIEVRPTIKGLRAGKDEVLERALRYLQDQRPKTKD